MGRIYNEDPLDERVMEWVSMRFHHSTKKGVQFKSLYIFISGIFHFMFLDLGLPWVTKTMGSETVDKARDYWRNRFSV